MRKHILPLEGRPHFKERPEILSSLVFEAEKVFQGFELMSTSESDLNIEVENYFNFVYSADLYLGS
jgi:hypothetical protein